MSMKESMQALPGVQVGVVDGTDDRGRPLVRLGSDAARASEVVWSGEPLDWRACAGLRVVVGLRDGDPGQPIVLGLLDAPPARDGPVRIESEREIVLACGQSRIALRADGRVEISGAYVLSRSSGPNKLKGGTVDIN